MYSDQDITQARTDWQNNSDTGLNIEPFDETNCLTPVGYDFRVGKEGFSWKKKCVVNIEQDDLIEIEPGDTVVIRTLESLTLSKEISATVHSIVSKIVTKGLSDISTTIDPGWLGTLLITIHNNRDTRAFLKFKATFCTVCFYKLDTASKVNRGTPANRNDLWDRLLEIASHEKDRVDKEEKERKKNRNLLLICLVILAFMISIVLSWYNPSFGSSIAAFLAILWPIIYDRFIKPNI